MLKNKFHNVLKKLKGLYRRVEFCFDNFSVNRNFNKKVIPNPYPNNAEKKYYSSLPKILWIGANSNQDQIGFISELKSISELTIFKNEKGDNQVFFDRAHKKKCKDSNTQILIDTIRYDNFDIVMGQIWPDLINYRNHTLQTLLKEKKIKSICVCMDDFMPERWKVNNEGQINGPAGFGSAIDLYATSDILSISRYSKLGLNAAYLPFGCSKNMKMNISKDIDISFIGSNYGIRGEYMRYLENKGLRVKVFGPGFINGHLNSTQVIEIYNRSKIVIGLSQVGYQKSNTNLKTRDFDVISTGSFYLSNSTSELNAFFTPGLHYVRFENKNDLYNKIIYYLKHSEQREKIALNGYNHGIKNFLWRNNLNYIFSILN